MKALNGIRVIDLSHVIAGPTASYYLAQQGAEVIKIERPGSGDILRAGAEKIFEGHNIGFASINSGKRSLAIDLHHARGREILTALIKTSQVFIENFRPGAIARLGFDYDAVRALNPSIVYASISGYGQEGEWGGRAAYDHVIQALTGMMLLQGDEKDEPIKVGFPVIDAATGMQAAYAIMAALLQREREGKGVRLDLSMVQASMQLMWPHVSKVLATGRDMPRVGNRGFSGSPGAATFRGADGWIATAANTPKQFRALCDLLGLPDVPDDPSLVRMGSRGDAGKAPVGFVEAVDGVALRKKLDAAFALMNVAKLEQDLAKANVPSARLRTIGEFLTDTLGKGRVTLPVRRPAGQTAGFGDLGSGFKASDDLAEALPSVPHLGADSAALLGELGIDAAELAKLVADGIVEVWEKAE